MKKATSSTRTSEPRAKTTTRKKLAANNIDTDDLFADDAKPKKLVRKQTATVILHEICPNTASLDTPETVYIHGLGIDPKTMKIKFGSFSSLPIQVSHEHSHKIPSLPIHQSFK
jgi:hypothetical protein